MDTDTDTTNSDGTRRCLYECEACGHRFRTGTHSYRCPDCGGDLRNLSTRSE